MAINYIYSIFLFRNPDNVYVYAYFAEEECLYVGKGRDYRAMSHLKFKEVERQQPEEDWKSYVRKPKDSKLAINRVWLSGRPLTLFVSFVKQNFAREVEAYLITKLDPSANLDKAHHREEKEVADHFKNPTFGSKLFCKVTNNELIII